MLLKIKNEQKNLKINFQIIIKMGINNLNNLHLIEQQVTALQQAITNLETALKPININLSPEDRTKYGRVNEQNKLFINKVHNFAQTQPDLKSPDVDWEEFHKDFQSRNLYESAINRLESLVIKMKNSKILHDYDNYQDALNDYAYTSYKAGSKIVGYEDKLKELKQFFAKNRKSTAPKEDKQA